LTHTVHYPPDRIVLLRSRCCLTALGNDNDTTDNNTSNDVVVSLSLLLLLNRFTL